MADDPKVTWIDGVNYRHVQLPVSDGLVDLEGITVRALRKALEDMDADAMVCYMFEQGEEVKIGCIGGVAGDSPHGIVVLVGPEVSKAVKEQYGK